jgi:hypothetical protein
MKPHNLLKLCFVLAFLVSCSSGPVVPKTIAASMDNTTILVGDTHSMRLTVTPSGAETVLTVTPSNNVVSVTAQENGFYAVKGLRTGTSILTASTDNGLTTTLNVDVITKDMMFINHLKSEGDYYAPGNSYSVNTGFESDGETTISYGFGYDLDDKEFYFNGIAINDDGSSELVAFGTYGFAFSSLRSGSGGNLITFESGTTSYSAMYNFGSIAFQSNRSMSIGTYTRVYNTFPSSISLVDLVEITASLIVSAYEALYFYCFDNGLPTSYYA